MERPQCTGAPGSFDLCGQCFWWTVKLLGGPHSSKGSRLIGDEMFFEGASTEVQSVMFGREAAWRLRYQCCVLQVTLHGPRSLRPSLSHQW